MKKNKLIKQLHLDKPTSHGGWPEGPSKGAYDDRPVNVIIADYLIKMGLATDSEVARLSESKLRQIIRKVLQNDDTY
tara:strand:- start:640 stop:870 length:231 start_codon:yes stop_codon:yes gene_type:complete